MSKMMKAMAGLLVLAGITSASVVSNATFQELYSTGSTLSGLTSSGFMATYDAGVGADTRTYAHSYLNGSSQALAVGESLEFSFDWASPQIKNVSSAASAFAFGFDTGAGLFKVMIDTQPSSTFMNISYGNVYQFGNTTTMSNFTVAANTTPDSSAWLVAGNTPTIKTTLFRTAETGWTVSVDWGGQTYSASVAGYATDGAVDMVWVGSGASSGSYFDTGDNYTISNVSVNLIPEPATIGMLGLGALIAVVIRRMHK